MPLYLADIRQEMEKFPRKTKDYPILKIKKLESVGFRGLKSIIFKAIVQGETDNYRTAIQFFDVDYSDIKDDTFTEDVGIDGTKYYYHKPRVSRNPVHIKCTCFTGDTLIPLASGKSVPIKDLVGLKEFFVYSFDRKQNKVVIGKGYNCEIKETNSELVEVELDNGHKVKCTPDHKFLLKGGTLKEAKDLLPGDSLEPLYRNTGEITKGRDGYEQVYTNGKWTFTHNLSDDYNLNNVVYHKSAGGVRHHVDFNKRNNNPTNINRMTWTGHRDLHAKHVSKTLHRPEVKLKSAKVTSARLSTNLNPMKNPISVLKNLAAKVKSGLGLGGFRKNTKTAQFNHKVISVNKLEYKEDTYCFTVEKFGNFMIDVDGGKDLSSGVAVMNCMDFRMRWEKQLYDNAGLIGNWTRYTRKTPPPPVGRPYVNPQNILGFCKHLDSLKNALRNSGRITN